MARRTKRRAENFEESFLISAVKTAFEIKITHAVNTGAASPASEVVVPRSRVSQPNQIILNPPPLPLLLVGLLLLRDVLRTILADAYWQAYNCFKKRFTF